MHAGRERGSRLAILALFGVMVTIVAPGAALAQDGRVKLGLRPLGQAGSYFDLTMRPGETRSLDVRISNDGDAAIGARTYAADVYTIINGGFGGRLRGASQTGMTQWLDYPTDVIRLPAGAGVSRSFTVAVPADASPGEFITSLVLENDQPIPGGEGVALDQTVRQAIAVVVTVPGQRSPALMIGAATHKVIAGRSIVAVAVENPGNVRLKPVVTFTLFDATGAQVSQASVQMDTFYAHTDTFVEVPLAALLLPGRYTVRLMLDEAAQGVRADKAGIAFVVEAPAVNATDTGSLGGLDKVLQAVEGSIPLAAWLVALAAGLALAVVAWFILVARRRRRAGASEC